jgi:hypothetical protein
VAAVAEGAGEGGVDGEGFGEEGVGAVGGYTLTTSAW